MKSVIGHTHKLGKTAGATETYQISKKQYPDKGFDPPTEISIKMLLIGHC
jgi:hypothetical protein